MGFKTAISSGRSIRIASNSVSTFRGPVVIILLCKVNAHFLGHFTSLILGKLLPIKCMEKITGANLAGKCANAELCISVMDKVKNNKQKTPMATGPLYLLYTQRI